MALSKIEVIDYESRHKITFDFTRPSILLPHKKISKQRKTLNSHDIKVKGKIFRQEKLTHWVKVK